MKCFFHVCKFHRCCNLTSSLMILRITDCVFASVVDLGRCSDNWKNDRKYVLVTSVILFLYVYSGGTKNNRVVMRVFVRVSVGLSRLEDLIVRNEQTKKSRRILCENDGSPRFRRGFGTIKQAAGVVYCPASHMFFYSYLCMYAYMNKTIKQAAGAVYCSASYMFFLGFLQRIDVVREVFVFSYSFAVYIILCENDGSPRFRRGQLNRQQELYIVLHRIGFIVICVCMHIRTKSKNQVNKSSSQRIHNSWFRKTF
jgi:hypothetical protein